MIDISIYRSEYIQRLTDEIRADRNLVERMLFAFGSSWLRLFGMVYNRRDWWHRLAVIHTQGFK